jgi:NTP pyrophosphatase (non-canonical NTP hydrolase)
MNRETWNTAEDNEKFALIDACARAIDLAPDTMQRYGVDVQRAKAIEECGELINAIKQIERQRLFAGGPDTDACERAIIDECADVLIMAISCASTIGAINWREQLAERIEFKAQRTRERMRK